MNLNAAAEKIAVTKGSLRHTLIFIFFLYFPSPRKVLVLVVTAWVSPLASPPGRVPRRGRQDISGNAQ
jgi:hypothetical protein